MATVKCRTWKTKKGISKSWYIDYKDTFGNRKIESGFKTKVEAEKALAKALQEIENGYYVDTNKSLTFAQLADKYWKYYAELHLKETSLSCYQNCLSHLLPVIGDLKVLEITPNTMNEYIRIKQSTTNLSNTTINKHLVLAKSILNHAIDNGLLARNPLDRLKKLKEEQIEQQCLTQKEVYAVLEVAKKHYPDFYPLLITAIFTGARQGELFVLTWDKINFVEGYIKIDRRVHNKTIDTPKTRSSNRKINLPDEVIRVLKEWRLRCPHSEMNLVFPNDNGGFLDRHNVRKRQLNPVLRRAGVSEIRFHDLRHTFASLLLANDAHPKYVQDQMGHASIKITMDTYSHLLPEAHKKGVETLNKILDIPKLEEKERRFGT
ncbi:site-specific integrase [bacterium]|nr:site-specific integrase [bacterium]